jgi:hypothetical protein
MKRTIVLLLTVSLLSVNGYAYGPRGHQLVGAIADRRLAKKQTIANKVDVLLDGLTLERVATLPDEIKGFQCGRTGNIEGIPQSVNRELQAFVDANCSGPSHNEFHYTNIPVFGDEDYDGGEVGRGKFDIVQMIPFSIRVLKGEEPERNDRGISKMIAVIIITHYLGDIHQPLHVGAEFYDKEGNPFLPTVSNRGFASQGGNKLTLFTFMRGGRLTEAGKLHSYWDGQTVKNAFGDQNDRTVARRLANREPQNWELSGAIETWSEQLANGILPVSREAHNRLAYKDIEIQPGQRDIVSGRCDEKRKRGGQFYAVWASNVVKEQIHKGGWRLAALLENAL